MNGLTLEQLKQKGTPQKTGGLTLEQLNEKKKFNPLDSFAKIAGFFPGKQVGEAIGTLGGLGITKAKEVLGKVPAGTTAQFDITAPTPTQTLGDIAKGASLVASAGTAPATTLLGKAAQFGGLSAVSGAGEAMIEEKPVSEVSKEALKAGAIGATTGLATGLAEKGIKGLANLFGATGEKIQTSVIKPSQVDMKDGFNIKNIEKYKLANNYATG